MYPTYDLSINSKVHIRNEFIKYFWMKECVLNDPNLNPNNYPWNPVIYGWAVTTCARGIGHELGHSLGLQHVNCEEGIMNGTEQTRNYFSPVEISVMSKNLAMKNIRKYVVCENFNNLKYISSNETWDFDARIYRNIQIESGVTLTITCKIYLSASSTITVNQGAKLIIDGGLITSACLDPWQGIEVWGNGNLYQNYTNQGVVELINGATIENAVCGVFAGKSILDPDGNSQIDPAFAGGIVKANGAKFINNQTSISLVKFSTNTALNNKSYIKFCEFKSNSFGWLSRFVTLEGVDGINIITNTFTNTNYSQTNGLFNGFGILALDANINVDAYSLDGGILIPNKFFNLYCGIRAISSNSMKSFSAKGCEFINNSFGISSTGINFAIIKSNKFDIGIPSEFFSQSPGVGLMYNQGTGFTIEDNEFSSTNNGTIGCIISGTSFLNDMVYKNNFHDLSKALQIQQGSLPVSYTMMSVSPPPPPNPIQYLAGVKFKCNQFNEIGFADVAAVSWHLGNPQSACGSMTSTANNLFSNTFGFNHKDIWINPGVPAVDYYYYPGSTSIHTAPQSNLYNVNLHPCDAILNYPVLDYSVGCPPSSNINPNPVNLITDINTKNTQIVTLTSRVDGNNTQTLLNKINSNMSPGQLKNTLLAPGPYLSDIVLLATINRSNPLPPGILKEIIVPNSPLTTNVMTVLNTKNLPAGIKADILAVQTGTSARTILEQQIAELIQQKDLSTAELMRYYLNDSIAKIDSAIIFLATQSDLDSKRLLVQAYLLKQDCINATTLINQLPQQTADDASYKQFFTIIANLCMQGKTIYDLTPAQLQTINTIVTANTTVSTAAKAVITTVNGTFFPDIIEELIVPEDQTLRGYLFNNLSCNNNSVANDTIVLLDSTRQIVHLLSSVITDANGYFKFNFNDLIYLDQKAKYTFGTKSGAVIQDTIFKTIQEWISASPVNLNLKKLKADFVNDTVACFNDTVHFTNKTMFGKKPYTYNWSFAFHVGSTQTNPVIKFNSAGIYNISLIASDALGCQDTAIKQIIIPACPSIFGTVYENADCGGSPVVGDTIVLKDNSGNIVSTVTPVITNSNGEFNFISNEIQLLDTTVLYTLATKSGFELQDIIAKNILQWKSESPLFVNLNNNKKEWLSIYQHLPSLQNISTKCDLSDNLYVFGYTAIDSYNEKALLLKYNTVTGNLLWQQEFFPLQNTKCRSNDMVIDQNGNIYLSCIFNSNSYNAGWDNIYLLKFSSDGSMLWSRNYGAIFDKKDYVNIELDNSGNIIISAAYYLRTSNLLFLKYDPSGNLLVDRVFDFGGSEYIIDMKIDTNNNIYFTGADNLLNAPKGKPVNGIITYCFNPVANTLTGSTYLTYNGSDRGENLVIDPSGNTYVVGCINFNQIFVIKYDQYFNQQWFYIYNEVKALSWLYSSIRIVDGNLYVGSYTSYADQSGFTLFKLNLQGNLIWSNKYDAPVYFTKDYYWVLMDNDNQNNIYLSGAKWNGIDHDIFTIKYLPDGSTDWISTTVYPDNEGPIDMLVSPNNNIYFTGISRVLPTYDKILTAKYSQCPSTANVLRYSNPANNNNTANNSEVSDNHLSSVIRLQSSVEYVNMFPNPNDGNFYFNYNITPSPLEEGRGEVKCQFSAFDPTGKKVYSIEIKGGKNTVMINSNNFSNGVYYYQVIAGNRLIKTERIVIAK